MKPYICCATVATILIFCQTASADVIDANWWSNRTSSSNVVEFGPEALRLQGGATSGFLEGTVLLPIDGDWTINLSVHTDESINLPLEFVDSFVDGVFVQRINNTPPGTTYTFDYDITGTGFNYRFEFGSPSTVFGHHLVVDPGTVTAIPEPNSTVMLFIGSIGCIVARARRARATI